MPLSSYFSRVIPDGSRSVLLTTNCLISGSAKKTDFENAFRERPNGMT